jgi:hypothetical protein
MVHRVRPFRLGSTLCLLAALSIGAVGPAAAGGGYDEQRAGLHAAADDYGRTVVEGGVLGALAGATTGALAGMMTGDSRNIGRGALIGAALGGFGGLVDGTAVAESKQRYARAEEGLDRAIGKARERNAKLQRVVVSADRLVAVRRAELTRLQGEGSGDRRAELQRAVDGDIHEIDAALAKARTARDEARSLLDKFRDAPRAGDLRQAASANDDAVRRLAADRDQLRTMRSGL